MSDASDPSRAMRDQFEKLFVDGVNQMVRSTQALRQLGVSLETSLDGKQVMDAQLRQGLEMLNLPTREDMTRVLCYLQRLESRLLDLDEKIDAIVDAQGSIADALITFASSLTAPLMAADEPAPAKVAKKPAPAKVAKKPAPAKVARKKAR